MTSPGTSPGTETLGQRPATRPLGRGTISGILITALVHGGLIYALYESQRRETPPPPAVRDVIVTKMVQLGKPREKFWLPRNVVTPPPPKPPPQAIKIATSPDAAPAPPPPVKPPPKVEDEKISSDLKRALQRAKSLAQAAKEEPPEGSLTGSLEGTSNVAEIGDEYATKVHDAIHRNWAAPSGLLDETQLRSLVALVRVSIAVDGRLGAPVLKQSSGNQTFDDAALQAVRATGNVPPMPPEVRSRFRSGVEIEFDGKDLTR
ncbi:MAG TPA: energy transducer TonB [Polyangia bacterium]